MHIAISGFTTLQKGMFISRQKTKASKVNNEESEDFKEVSSKNKKIVSLIDLL